MQSRVQELLGRFGGEVAEQLCGAFNIRKEHRDLLPLAFQSGA
jgi:hypothetical protein